MSILDGLNERIARHKNRDFLKAAMAPSALSSRRSARYSALLPNASLASVAEPGDGHQMTDARKDLTRPSDARCLSPGTREYGHAD